MSVDTRVSDADLIAGSLAEPDLFTAVFDRHRAEMPAAIYVTDSLTGRRIRRSASVAFQRSAPARSRAWSAKE